MNKLFTLVILLIITSSCSVLKANKIAYYKPETTDKAQTNWDNIIGRWYGITKIEDGETREFIDERKSDGTYEIEFHSINKTGKVSIQKEFGEWGLSGNIYFTVVRSISNSVQEQTMDLEDPYTRDAYKIIKLNETFLVYKHVVSGDKYSVKKVDTEFTFSK